jgi:hypothetical protein
VASDAETTPRGALGFPLFAGIMTYVAAATALDTALHISKAQTDGQRARTVPWTAFGLVAAALAAWAWRRSFRHG